MVTSRSIRHAVVGAVLLLIGGLGILERSTVAQMPQPRLTSLSRQGMRAGETVELSLRGTDLEGATQLWFDHPGIKAVHVKDLTHRVVSAPDVPLGHFDVRAIGTFGVSNPRAFVVGDRPESLESEPNNTPDKADAIVINTVVHGEVNGAADIDCFRFEGTKGQRVFLDVEAERIDSRLDPTIRLSNSTGTEIAESRDVFGVDPFLDVMLPADGSYVIKIHDAIYAGSAEHVYRLTIHDGPHLDAILPMAVEPDRPAAVTVIGRCLGAGATVDQKCKADGRALERVKISLEMPSEVRLGVNPLDQSRLFVPSAAAAAHDGFEWSHVRVSPTGASPTVSNRLFLARAIGPVVVEQEPNSDDEHPQTVVPPCDISGNFAVQGDVDLFRFQARKGEVWWIEAFAERIGSMADPAFVVQKVGPKGQPPQDLVAGDDLPDTGTGPRFNTQSVDAALRWQVPDDGLYQVSVSDLYGSQRGHPRLTYRLVIRHEQPGFTLVMLPDSAAGIDVVNVQPGGRAVAMVTAIRQDGFGGPIRVEAIDLPAGVRAVPVTIGPGQTTAPIIFEAAENAKATVGTASLVGTSRFGDRKEALEYVDGASALGPDLKRVALAGGMTGPPNPAAPAVAPARLVRGFVMAVRASLAALDLTAKPEKVVVAQGHRLPLDLAVTRRAGFVEAVNVTATELPPNLPAAAAIIAKDARTAVLPLFVPKNVPPGIYTFILRGTGAFPFSKDPNVKQKPNINITEPSNPITLVVRPAPVSLSVDAKGGEIKPAASLEIDVSVARQNGFVGPVSLALTSPRSLKLTAAPVLVAASQASAKLVVNAAKDSPPGPAPLVFVRARVTQRGEDIEVDEPVGISIAK
jgi:hypothetical protein